MSRACCNIDSTKSRENHFHDSYTGCPSVCPERLVGMRLAGYCTTIRSERRLCQEVKVNLAYRWFCGLGLG